MRNPPAPKPLARPAEEEEPTRTTSSHLPEHPPQAPALRPQKQQQTGAPPRREPPLAQPTSEQSHSAPPTASSAPARPAGYRQRPPHPRPYRGRNPCPTTASVTPAIPALPIPQAMPYRPGNRRNHPSAPVAAPSEPRHRRRQACSANSAVRRPSATSTDCAAAAKDRPPGNVRLDGHPVPRGLCLRLGSGLPLLQMASKLGFRGC